MLRRRPVITTPTTEPMVPVRAPVTTRRVNGIGVAPVDARVTVPPGVKCFTAFAFADFPVGVVVFRVCNPAGCPTMTPTGVRRVKIAVVSAFILPSAEWPVSVTVWTTVGTPDNSPKIPVAGTSFTGSKGTPAVPRATTRAIMENSTFDLRTAPAPVPTPMVIFTALPVTLEWSTATLSPVDRTV